MAIVIKIGEKANEKKVRLELNARQAINGDIMIFDHGDVDIVLSPKNKKQSKKQTAARPLVQNQNIAKLLSVRLRDLLARILKPTKARCSVLFKCLLCNRRPIPLHRPMR